MATNNPQLQGWKQIAAYLNRDERTVKRWEKQRGLPVRRIPGDGRANVYAVVAELDAWLGLTALALETESPDNATDDLDTDSELDLKATLPDLPVDTAQVHDPLDSANVAQPQVSNSRSRFSSSGHRIQWALLVSVALVLMAAIVVRAFTTSGSTSTHSKSVPDSSLTRLSSQPGVNQLYLQGVSLYEQRTPAALDQARLLLMQAIARDPQFAPAYAALANVYLLSREYATMVPEDAYAAARAAADRAVALDPNLPEAHASLGFIDFFSDWNPAAATTQFQTALHLDPNCIVAQHWYGSMLIHQGRYPEALQHLDIAQRLAPTSSAIQATRALALGLNGHRDEAIDMLQSITANGFDAASPHRILAILSLVEPHQTASFLLQRQRVAELRHDQQELTILAAATTAFHRAGEQAMWASILRQERTLNPDPTHPNDSIVQAEAELGDDQQALSDLDLLAKEHDPMVIGIPMDPVFLKYHGNPSYEHVMLSIGLHSPQH